MWAEARTNVESKIEQSLVLDLLLAQLWSLSHYIGRAVQQIPPDRATCPLNGASRPRVRTWTVSGAAKRADPMTLKQPARGTLQVTDDFLPGLHMKTNSIF